MTDTDLPAVSTVRWWRNGDHPHDRVSVGSTREGAVVRFFRHPDVDGATVHVDEHGGGCGRTWHDHGWIDQGEHGLVVCPGDLVLTFPDGAHLVDNDLSATERLLGEAVSLLRGVGDAPDRAKWEQIDDWARRAAAALPAGGQTVSDRGFGIIEDRSWVVDRDE